tara:strand:+ start:95 stop:385 length:291 start_codon:yes stop_codon:yes gene_type:complete
MSLNYPTTSKSDLTKWMEEKNLQMSQYLEKEENQYDDTANLLEKLWQDLDSGAIAGKDASTFYNEVKSRKDGNPAPFNIEQYKAIDFSTIIEELPD